MDTCLLQHKTSFNDFPTAIEERFERSDPLAGEGLELLPARRLVVFETELLANDENLAALADLSGVWIDRVHARKLPRMIVLDMDSSVTTHGDQEGTAYNGHFGCTC